MNFKVLIICFLISLVNMFVYSQAKTVEIKNNFFYLNGEKVFIKGVGYDIGAIPGYDPSKGSTPFDSELLKYDMERISNAGFNTIRTWGALNTQELDVIKNYDLNIIMGIWISPEGDFSNSDFINKAKTRIKEVISYSKYYDNIIAYLIQNEPMPETIFNSGYNSSGEFWKSLIDIIHSEHPGRQVSISNTCVGSFIDPSLFDFSAYNLYPYSPVTINHSHGFAAYVEYLNSLKPENKPLLVSEFGLSVSPIDPYEIGKGGNTEEEQKDAIVKMYSSLLDGGANGACIFNYSDGWYKGGNEYSHDNDKPEEWFGMIKYQDVNDKYGVERPVWEAIKKYQSGIIISPRNEKVYTGKIPIELFINDEINKVIISSEQDIMHVIDATQKHIIDELVLDGSNLTDYVLNFKFLGVGENLVKEENISVLVSEEVIVLPKIEIATNPQNFTREGSITVSFKVSNSNRFELGQNIYYTFYPHDGWEYGYKYTKSINIINNIFEFSDDFVLSNEHNVVTFSGGFDVVFGKLKKRIHSTKTLLKQNINSIYDKELKHNRQQLLVYPNPANEFIAFNLHSKPGINETFFFYIFSRLGEFVKSGMIHHEEKIHIANLCEGTYVLLIKSNTGKQYQVVFAKN